MKLLKELNEAKYFGGTVVDTLEMTRKIFKEV